ncbi:hypothetical protein FNV43_RR01716 [Rhamnella rubrinervis]|uniref:Retrotransposon Copia-like N-terminal domain-containing protein n=1 Tax=Rhamnella rubrinervis TaxID=2594499 RepID=A0A8K0HRH0_9ROSA|nr:hypothetical protein FNV43_RR01716 [Rhamnella rubrinervis]
MLASISTGASRSLEIAQKKGSTILNLKCVDAQYEPELFSGAKVRDETYTAFENIYPVLTEFRKNQQWHKLLDKLLNKRRKEAEDRARAAEEKNNELTKQIEELRAQQDRMEESLLQYHLVTLIQALSIPNRVSIRSILATSLSQPRLFHLPTSFIAAMENTQNSVTMPTTLTPLSKTVVTSTLVNTTTLGNLISLNASSQIPFKFAKNGDNYASWKSQMINLLFGYGLLGFVDGSNPCPSKDDTDYLLWTRQDHLILLGI